MSTNVVQDAKQPLPSRLNPASSSSKQRRLGEYLASARQSSGLSEAAIATKLHLSVAIIQALEQDQYDKMPSAVFVRGYVKKYARLLELDEQELPPLPNFDPPRDFAPPPVVKNGPRSEVRSNHAVVQIVTWTIVLGILALVGMWWQGQLVWEDSLVKPIIPEPTFNPSASKNALPTILPKNIIATPVPMVPPTIIPTGSIKTTTPPSTPLPVPSDTRATTGLVVENKIPSQTQAQALPTATPPPSPQVVLEFMGTSWIDIRDSKQKFKLVGRMHKGEKRTLEGTPPYKAVIGNSTSVEITINGKPFSTKNYSRGGTARFTLDPSSSE